MGRRTALRTVGRAVMYSDEAEGSPGLGGRLVVGREGTERERWLRLKLGGKAPGVACWRAKEVVMPVAGAVAVAEEAVVEDWESGEGRFRSSLVVVGGCSWPYCTSWGVNERGRVWVARSKPATADSMPVSRNLVDWDVVRVRSLALASRWCSFAEWVPLSSGASEDGGRPCHISQKMR